MSSTLSNRDQCAHGLFWKEACGDCGRGGVSPGNFQLPDPEWAPGIPPVIAVEPPTLKPANPKDLMGLAKAAVLRVVPPASIIGEAEAMYYGAYLAPKKDGSLGYGPFNWRDPNQEHIDALSYIDAAMRHCLAWVDGEENAPDSKVNHLKHAKASLGILIDALSLGIANDNRPNKGLAAELMQQIKESRNGN